MDFKNKISPKKVILFIYITALLLFFISLFWGRYQISFSEIKEAVTLFREQGYSALSQTTIWNVVYHLRIPRLLLVSGIGMSLSITGTVYQGIFRNPLVSPDILGVSAGAGFGVALGLVLGDFSLLIIYILACFFGFSAVLGSYWLSRQGKGDPVMMMVLAGIIISSLFNAFLSLIKYLADPYDQLPGIVFWLMGSFSRAGWSEVLFVFPFMLIGLVVVMILRWQLNVLSSSDEEAISLGVSIKLLRIIFVFFTTLMVAASVATTGQITWIGLVVPHICRFIVGANHRYLLPAAAGMGPLLMIIMDNIARGLTAAEIPISIITSFIGAPFFAYLLFISKDSGWS